MDIGELATLTETSNVIDCNNTLTSELRKAWNQKYILKYINQVSIDSFLNCFGSFIDLIMIVSDHYASMKLNHY